MSMNSNCLQYADDTGIILDGNEKSLKKVLDLLDQFAKYSGLKPNIDKTKAIWIGSMKNSARRLCSDKNLDWSFEPFKFLGVTFSLNIDEIPRLNYDSKLLEVKKLIKHWEKRNISVLGKITVVKSILLSKFTHLFISLPKPSNDFMNILEKILFINLSGMVVQTGLLANSLSRITVGEV